MPMFICKIAQSFVLLLLAFFLYQQIANIALVSQIIGNTSVHAATPAEHSGAEQNSSDQTSSSSQNIRVWKENGKIRASNTSFPEKSSTIQAVEKPPAPSNDLQEAQKTRKTSEQEKRIEELQRTLEHYEAQRRHLNRQRQQARAQRKETPFYDLMGHAVVPVILGYQGRETTVYMMLDTGATVSSIHQIALDPLGITDFDVDQAMVADGRRVKVMKARLDYVRVGPFIKKNFLISTFPYKKKKRQTVEGGEILGLLGMNFLRDHPFTLDHSRKVIIWW